MINLLYLRISKIYRNFVRMKKKGNQLYKHATISNGIIPNIRELCT